jgi:hypothetical protein
MIKSAKGPIVKLADVQLRKHRHLCVSRRHDFEVL